MRTFSIAAAGLLAIASSATASNYIVRNYCDTTMYLTFANPASTQTDLALPSGLAFLSAIEGEGNAVVVTNQPNQYWSAGGWKAVFGTSAKDATLWWSLSAVNGDPIAPGTVNVTSSGATEDVCGHATDYVSGVKQCPDTGVTLVWDLCSDNA
ncbi:hypothetical protein LTR53_003608 [Teratosphaeriaceae sp. CCFEE 6253]|nr:hypothetical protein LTR53_003608 [Teratosphaeriaceae sp. CCFEE 6253]